MSDARVREIERAAGAGDVEAQARLLVERVRAGRLTQERLELAAFCGNPQAIVAAGPERVAEIMAPVVARHAQALANHALHRQRHPDALPPTSFGPWLHVLLERWILAPAFSSVRASLAAARLMPLNGPEQRVVTAADVWLLCPCEDHRMEWVVAWHDANRASSRYIGWLTTPPGYLGAGNHGPAHIESIYAAAHILGSPPVHAAIRSALIGWALA